MKAFSPFFDRLSHISAEPRRLDDGAVDQRIGTRSCHHSRATWLGTAVG